MIPVTEIAAEATEAPVRNSLESIRTLTFLNAHGEENQIIDLGFHKPELVYDEPKQPAPTPDERGITAARGPESPHKEFLPSRVAQIRIKNLTNLGEVIYNVREEAAITDAKSAVAHMKNLGYNLVSWSETSAAKTAANGEVPQLADYKDPMSLQLLGVCENLKKILHPKEMDGTITPEERQILIQAFNGQPYSPEFRQFLLDILETYNYTPHLASPQAPPEQSYG